MNDTEVSGLPTFFDLVCPTPTKQPSPNLHQDFAPQGRIMWQIQEMHMSDLCKT